jgi:quinol-cytochrome oxidoreductase complex cytochrome b subunit
MKSVVATWAAAAGLFAGAAALALHQQGDFVIASTLCGREYVAFVLSTLVSTGVLIFAGVVSWHDFRRSRPNSTENRETGLPRQFLALVATLSAVLFLFAVLLQASAVLFLPACVG